MSGGVDSSVAAAMLCEQGYDVIGVFMRNWAQPIDEKGSCPWVEDQKDVRKVCSKLNIPCYTFNFEKEYEERVVEYFFKEYRAGRTPNPDVLCNKEIKFDMFKKKAAELGADYIATGHYARIRRDSVISNLPTGGQFPISNNSEVVHLLKGVDGTKDQSYFLWKLDQKQLSNVLFPIGDLQKVEVRKLAGKYGLSTATKKDSQGICFIGPIKVRNFLKSRIEMKPGPVITSDGKVIANHEGIWFYTIGQRLGIDSVKWPITDVPVLYVKDKIMETNTLVAGLEKELYADCLICDNINWVVKKPELPLTVYASIRYRHEPEEARISDLGEGRVSVKFTNAQRAITPGQSVVFYRDDELIGGGVIVNPG